MWKTPQPQVTIVANEGLGWNPRALNYTHPGGDCGWDRMNQCTKDVASLSLSLFV